MPYIQIETAIATKEQKEKLISEVTRVASEILGVDETSFYVLKSSCYFASSWVSQSSR